MDFAASWPNPIVSTILSRHCAKRYQIGVHEAWHVRSLTRTYTERDYAVGETECANAKRF
jgi:hypothetical protein